MVELLYRTLASYNFNHYINHYNNKTFLDELKHDDSYANNIKTLKITAGYRLVINKLPSTLKKLWIYKDIEMNNLPLNLNYLYSNSNNIRYYSDKSMHYKFTSINSKITHNLPPNIIYLGCNKCDLFNLPRALLFIACYIKIIPELINITHNKFNLNKYTKYKKNIPKYYSILYNTLYFK